MRVRSDSSLIIDESRRVTILGISGSLRSESYSTSILHALSDHAAPEINLIVKTLEDIPPYNQDLDTEPAIPAIAEFRTAVGNSDGLVLSTPEYNHGIPGVLKNALDWGSRPAFTSCFVGKPVLIISSSPGLVGGVRAQYQIRETLISMLARVVPGSEIVIGDVRSKQANGKFVDERSLAHVAEGLRRLCQEVAVYASVKRNDAAHTAAE